MQKQRGVALIEVIVASALLGLIVYAGFKMMSLPDIMRGNARQQVNSLEKYQQAFNLFYRQYNQPGPAGGTDFASQIEALNANVVQIRFNTSATALTIGSGNTYIEIGNGDTTLNNLLSYAVLPQPNETASLCKLTTLANSSNNTWNFVCPGGNYTGFGTAFSNNQISELPIVMIDGRLCFVTAQTTSTLTIDPNRNNCLTPTPNNAASDHRGMFTVPRLVVFSTDKQFTEGIFESFYSPRKRFSASGSNYPQQY